MVENRQTFWHKMVLGVVRTIKQEHSLIVDTVLLGIVGALSAQLFIWMLRFAQKYLLTAIAGYAPPELLSEGGTLQVVIGPHGLWLIPLVTTLGGLLAGILIYSLAPEAEGHGTDTAVKSYHQAGGKIRARISPLKMIASAITIGSGGTGGREGPTALISAGIGSIYGTLTDRSDADRRLLVLIGMASGLSAIFRSPIGTALFAIEVLYSGMEFEAGALIYTMLGSVVAYAVNGLFVGYQPLFQVPPTSIPQLPDYFWYVLLGMAAGLVATVLPMVFYGIRDLFHAIPIPPHFKPAIGGLGVGLLALVLPQVLGGGYGYIQKAINGQIPTGTLLALVFGEMLALAFTISSGGSGGVFAPSLFVGAMLGGLMAQLFHQPPAALVVVGMAAVFGGAARIPMATLFMAMEMTADYALLGPAALAIFLSYMIQTTLSRRLKYKSLYEAQVPFRFDSPAHFIENLDTVLRLLGQHRFSVPPSITHLHLRTLLASGIPVDLPDRKQLAIGILRSDSRLVGQPIEAASDELKGVELMAIFRRGKMVLPGADLVLRAKDRLLAVVTSQGKKRLDKHADTLSRRQVITKKKRGK
jgi:chloride channel protein, CIC family